MKYIAVFIHWVFPFVFSISDSKVHVLLELEFMLELRFAGFQDCEVLSSLEHLKKYFTYDFAYVIPNSCVSFVGL